ncbi:hypothetical protein EB796_002936 [Bugula neritina]|uniref:Uncharacterized protein n=1 Tax=Bugula neritina TaxID=10212 RepID=A0A7J7KJ65_BUGNE|nr:hypothetical protein EB796_002936 [Bugula neritina]
MYGIVNVFMFINFPPKYIDHVKNVLRIVHFVLWQHVHNNFLYGTNLFVDCVSTFSLEQSRKKFGNCIMTSATVVSSSLENY